MALVGRDTYQLTKAIISLIDVGIKIGKELALEGPHVASYHAENWNKLEKRRIRSTIKRLEGQKLICWSEEDGKTKLTLSERGRRKVLRYKLDDLKIRKTYKWDGLFRVIIFDIPENKKAAREALRKKLKELEFHQLQKSVFVTPFECRDEIDFLKNVYEVAPCVSYILAKEIQDIKINISPR